MAKPQATSESDSQHALETQCIQLLVEKARAEGGGTRQQVRAAARRFVRRHRRNRSYLRQVLRAVVASSALAVRCWGWVRMLRRRTRRARGPCLREADGTRLANLRRRSLKHSVRRSGRG